MSNADPKPPRPALPDAPRRPGLLPCATCPWIVDKDATTIPRYNHAKACGLLNTVGCDDAFRPIMACHHSTEAEPFACNGYLAQVGWSNLNVRRLAAKGQIANPDRVAEACAEQGICLETSYELVLEKLAASLQGDRT
jgi:hypothetical protein